MFENSSPFIPSIHIASTSDNGSELSKRLLPQNLGAAQDIWYKKDSNWVVQEHSTVSTAAVEAADRPSRYMDHLEDWNADLKKLGLKDMLKPQAMTHHDPHFKFRTCSRVSIRFPRPESRTAVVSSDCYVYWLDQC